MKTLVLKLKCSRCRLFTPFFSRYCNSKEEGNLVKTADQAFLTTSLVYFAVLEIEFLGSLVILDVLDLINRILEILVNT